MTQAGELFIIQNREIVLEQTMPDGQGKYNCCLFDSDGQLYVGASEGRAFLFNVTDEGLKLKRRYDFDGLGVLSSLYKTEDGLLFACANNGVGCFTPSGRYSNLNLYPFRNSIDHMLVDYQGNLWFSSSRLGVLRLAKSSFSDIYASADMEQKVVNSVTKWNGRLYIGTDNGLDIYYPVTRSQTYSQLSQTLKDARIRCVFTDSFGELWICTYGKG